MRDLIVPLLPTGQDCLPRTSAPRTAPLEWIDPHYSEFPDNPQGHFCSDVDDGLLSDFQCYRYSLDRHRNTTLPKPTNFTASKAEEIITAVKVFARYEVRISYIYLITISINTISEIFRSNSRIL